MSASWNVLERPDGRYAVDFVSMQRIFRAYCATYMQLDDRYARTVERPDLGGPTLVTVEVDWPKLHADAFSAGVNLYANACAELYGGRRGAADGVAEALRQLQLAAAENRRKFLERMRQATARTMASIERTAAAWGGVLVTAQLVRDISAGTVVSGAMILTGGSAAGLGLLGTGSALTGVAKWQDTDNLAAGLVAGVGALTLNALPFKPKGAEQAALVLVKAQWDVAQGLVEGKTMADASLHAAGKLAIDQGAGRLLKIGPVKEALSRMPVPIGAVVTESTPAEVFAKQATKQVLSKAAPALASAAVDRMSRGAAGSLAERAVVAVAQAPLRPVRRLGAAR